MYTAGVAAHLDWQKRSETVFGPINNKRYCGSTILAFSLRPLYSWLTSLPSPPLHHFHLQKDSQPTAELCFGVCEMRELGQYHGSGSGKQP